MKLLSKGVCQLENFKHGIVIIKLQLMLMLCSGATSGHLKFELFPVIRTPLDLCSERAVVSFFVVSIHSRSFIVRSWKLNIRKKNICPLEGESGRAKNRQLIFRNTKSILHKYTKTFSIPNDHPQRKLGGLHKKKQENKRKQT